MAVEKYQITISKGESRTSSNPTSDDFLGRFSHKEVRKLEKVIGGEYTVTTGSSFSPANRKYVELSLGLPTDSDSMRILQYLTIDKGYVINKVERVD